MAQVFPLVDDLSTDEARASLAGTLAALPDPWTLLRHRRIGDDAEPIEVVLVHPEIGVALLDEAPHNPEPSARQLRDYLDGQRFGEFFPGELPIVALSVAPEEFETVGERLANAFETAPRLSIADADWADAVIELLMVPEDLAMAPVGEREVSRMSEHAPIESEHFDEPDGVRFDGDFDEMSDEPTPRERFEESPREHFDALSSEPVRRERFDDAPRDRYAHSPSPEGEEPPLPLMVDWPFAASYQRRRRRGRIAALAAILVLLAGAGIAAWEYAGDDLTVAINDVTPRSHDSSSRSQDSASRSIEIPLPSQPPADQQAANPAPSAPPPVPAAPPVVMAQKPFAPPPPSPPKATPVEPLPQVAETKPPSPPPATTPLAAPAQTAATSQPTAKPEDSGKAPPKEPEKTQTASAPPPSPPEKPATQTAEAPPPPSAKPAAAPSPAKPKPTRTAKAAAPPRRAEPARHEPSQASRARPGEPEDNPPIDAADLPPLDQAPAPQRPTQLAAPNNGSSQPPAGGLGPPVPLWRSQQANNNPPPQAAATATPASADAGNRECRPYTSSTTLTGRGLRVEGIACRGTDGQWRLVSEVPLR